jgi:hypothetical protein
MSVENQSNGRLRLACDRDWCGRKFSPREPIATAKALRWRALNYGWLTEPEPEKQPSIPGVDDAARKVRDVCPECRRGT